MGFRRQRFHHPLPSNLHGFWLFAMAGLSPASMQYPLLGTLNDQGQTPLIIFPHKTTYPTKIVRQTFFRDMLFSAEEALKILE